MIVTHMPGMLLMGVLALVISCGSSSPAASTATPSASAEASTATPSASAEATPTPTATPEATSAPEATSTRAPTPTSTPAPPVTVNDGELTEWTARLTTTGNAIYDPLVLVLQQSGGVLSGSNRDNDREVDLSTTGSVDAARNVRLTSTITNGGSPRATIIFTGTISGPGGSQTISGTYTATGPSVTNAN